MSTESPISPLYLQIVETLRREIVGGVYASDTFLPPLRAMAGRWRCTIGTVQRAYAELAREGLVVTRPGQGSRVVSVAIAAHTPITALRHAALANHSERFLLDMLAAGYQPGEVEQSLRTALDRWQARPQLESPPAPQVVRFVGSHDPALSLVAARLPELAPGWQMDVRFAGSLGGLMALAQGDAELAGCHLWDQRVDSYNQSFVRHVLPGRRVALLTLAQRRLGLITAPGNPHKLAGLADLARPGLRFVNRQRGSGTRVWLDAHLQTIGVDADAITGYRLEVPTHSAVAEAIWAGQADVGVGIETAALAAGLECVVLAQEQYDLAFTAAGWEHPAVQALVGWLASPAAAAAIAQLGGYDVTAIGRLIWVQ